MSDRRNVLVLLSGGVDSTACVAYYISQKYSVNGLFVDYGQSAARYENKAALAISQHYNIPLKKIIVSGARKWGAGCIPGRNSFLLLIALMNFKYKSGLVAIGIHSGTDYWDCSKEFIEIMQTCFERYTDGCISIDAPFLSWKKNEIWKYSIEKKVPLELTYSCELGKEQPCGECLSCRDLEVLYAEPFAEGFGSK
jgi:7-cyano-7-deazaguanine synthase